MFLYFGLHKSDIDLVPLNIFSNSDMSFNSLWRRMEYGDISVTVGSGNDLLPSDYRDQWWLTLNCLRNRLPWFFNQNTKVFFHENALKITSSIWRPFCSSLPVLTRVVISYWKRVQVKDWQYMSRLPRFVEMMRNINEVVVYINRVRS